VMSKPEQSYCVKPPCPASSDPIVKELPDATTCPSTRNSVVTTAYAGIADGSCDGCIGLPSGFGGGRKLAISDASACVAGLNVKMTFFPMIVGRSTVYVQTGFSRERSAGLA